MTDPTPSPDVRELAHAEYRRHAFADAVTCVCGFKPFTSLDWEKHVLDAVVAAVSPVIRAEERVKVAEELDEEADRIKRVEWPADVPLAHVEGFERAADFIGIPALRDLDRAIARTHAHPEEGRKP